MVQEGGAPVRRAAHPHSDCDEESGGRSRRCIQLRSGGMFRWYLRENARTAEDMPSAWHVGRVSRQMLAGRHAQLHRRATARSPALVSMSWAARSTVWQAWAAWCRPHCRQNRGDDLAGDLRRPLRPELHGGMSPRVSGGAPPWGRQPPDSTPDAGPCSALGGSPPLPPTHKLDVRRRVHDSETPEGGRLCKACLAIL